MKAVSFNLSPGIGSAPSIVVPQSPGPLPHSHIGHSPKESQVVKCDTAFYKFREEFPALSCKCGHPLSLHSLNIEFHTCLANRCYCYGFSVPASKPVTMSSVPPIVSDYGYDPHDIAADFRPSGVGPKEMEMVTGDRPHTVDEPRTERGCRGRRAAVRSIPAAGGKACVGRFR